MVVVDYFLSRIGGSDRSMFLVTKALAARGHEVHVLASSLPKNSSDKRFENLTIHPSLLMLDFAPRPLRNMPEVVPMAITFLKVLHFIKDKRPEIILTHERASLGAIFAGKTMKTPVVAIVRGLLTLCPKWVKLLPNGKRCDAPCSFLRLKRCLHFRARDLITRPHVLLLSFLSFKLYEFVTSRATKIIATSDSQRRLLLNQVNSKRVTVIYNPIESRDIACNEIQDKIGPRTDPTFAYVGRLSYEKGVDVLLRAMKHLLDSNPSVRLIIIGEGPQRHTLEKLASDIGVAKNTLFLGQKTFEDVQKICSSAFAVVIPSLYESFGRVAFEAMAAGKPVIASSVGGLQELITNEINGLLVGPGDEKALALAMKQLLEDSSLYSKMVANGLNFVHQFALERIAMQYEQLLYETKKRK